jgi:hypothetical protein
MLKIPNLYQNHIYNKLEFNEYGIEKHNQKYKKWSYNSLTNYSVSSSKKNYNMHLISCHKAIQTIFYNPNQLTPILL